MYDIIAYDRYKDMKDKFRIVHPEQADQFIAGVLQWYQNEIIYPISPFMNVPKDILPPNVFNIVEYPNLDSEVVLNLFTESDINHLQELFNYDKKTAREEAIKIHNNQPADRHFIMLHDIEVVMGTYNLFYCYRDDAGLNPVFRNSFVKEVW